MPSPYSSKFVKLLQQLTAVEWKDLEKWLQSPWCNSNKNLPVLLAKLKPYHPDFSDRSLSKEKLFRQVLPGGKFSERRMNNLLSEAYLTTEKFLLYQRFKRADNLQQAMLAQEFQSRGLEDWFFRQTEQEITRMEAKEVKEWEDHLHLFRLRRRKYHHPNQNLRLPSGQAELLKMGEEIGLLYVLEKAALLTEMMSRSRLLQAEQYDIPAELQKWFAASKGITHPALTLYRMRFAEQGKKGLPPFLALKTALLESFDRLNKREQKIHLLSLLNDAKMLIKSGSLDITDSLPLYQLGLQTGALLNQGILSGNTYTAIVSASNTKGSFDFTAKFVDQWSEHLDEYVREDCAHWARAHTLYWQKNLISCRKVLQGYEFQHPSFQLIGRVLSTQVYVDLYLSDDSYQSFLFQYFDTVEKWIGRNKVWSRANKKSFLRFIQITRTLARFYAEMDPNPQKIEDLLEKESNIQALNWLKQRKKEIVQQKQKRLFRF